jgi:DNA-binding GntR family transcriptional regulator
MYQGTEDSQSATEPPANRSQSATAYSLLRERIVLGELVPGQTVTERGLVEETAIGKTPIREALAKLVTDGFVVAVPRRGYLITALTLSDADELIELWRLVGPPTVRLACERNRDEVLLALHECVDEMKSDLEAGRRFFVRVAEASGNRRLLEVNRRLFHDLYRFLFLAYRHEAPKDWLVRDLKAMRSALVKGNIDAAIKAYIGSIEHGALELRTILSSLPSVRRAPLTS